MFMLHGPWIAAVSARGYSVLSRFSVAEDVGLGRFKNAALGARGYRSAAVTTDKSALGARGYRFCRRPFYQSSHFRIERQPRKIITAAVRDSEMTVARAAPAAALRGMR